MIVNELSVKKFFDRVNKTSCCWLWTGDGVDYGHFWCDGKSHPAHRVSWVMHKGEIPQGMCVLHACDNTLCVNPDYLFLGSHKDNTQDMIQKGRMNPRYGEFCGWHKLVEDEVVTIREMYCNGCSQKELELRFNLPHSTIYNIVHRKSWKYL